MVEHKLSEHEVYSRLNEFRHICLELAVLNGLIYKKVNDSPSYRIDDSIPTEFDFEITFLIDASIIRLVRLYKVQPSLGRVLKEKTDHGTTLLSSLSDLWGLIITDKEKINSIWRNRIIAHSEDQISDYRPYHSLDSNYNRTTASIISSIRFAPLYYLAILNYARYLFDEADIHVKFSFGESEEFLIKQFVDKLNAREKDLLSNINLELQKKGFEEIPIPKYDGMF
jgi:hypothetical protein